MSLCHCLSWYFSCCRYVSLARICCAWIGTIVSYGCAVIAELVMQAIEFIALATSPISVRWWRRFVDDSNSCLKKCDVQFFHDHLNAINEHIQFTIEMPSISEKGESIAFLDTSNTVLKTGDSLYIVYIFKDEYLKKGHAPKRWNVNVIKNLVCDLFIYVYIFIYICIGYHMRGEVISVLSLERRYHILSRVSAANEGQNMIS